MLDNYIEERIGIRVPHPHDVLDDVTFLSLEVNRLKEENKHLKAERDKLYSQLPEGMRSCTILFKECEKGHGHLTATNWVQDKECLICRLHNLQHLINLYPKDDNVYEVKHDGFRGKIIGHYTTHEGKTGVVLQQEGTKVVHVYGQKWLTVSPEIIIDDPCVPKEQPTKEQIDMCIEWIKHCGLVFNLRSKNGKS